MYKIREHGGFSQSRSHTVYINLGRPILLQYGSILYLGAAAIHLNRLDHLQSRLEQTCLFIIQPLLSHQNAAIVGLVCRLLDGVGHGNLQTYCPQFSDSNQLPRGSH